MRTDPAVPDGSGDTGQRPAHGLTSPVVLTLTAVGFIIGTTEFMAIGVIPEIAADLHAPVGPTGLISSLYAASVAVTAIPVAVTVMHHRPRLLLPAGLLVFVAAHAVMALAPSLTVLIGARVLAATVHSLALGGAFATASAVVRPERRGAAVGMVFGGLSAAMFLGAPLGTTLAGAVGWRMSFALVGVVALLVMGAVLLTVPNLPQQPRNDRRALVATLRRPEVSKPLLVALGIQVANNLLFTYLGAYLAEITRLDGNGIALGLAAYGLAGVLGNVIGGRVADVSPRRWAVLAGLVMAAALAAIGVAGQYPVAAFALVAVWGMAQQLVMPIVTHQAVESGGGIAAALNPGAANVGIAGGGLVAGLVLGGAGIAVLPWVAAVAMVLLTVAVVLRRPVDSPERREPSLAASAHGGAS